MKKNFITMKMEAETIQKNAASPKSRMSRGNSTSSEQGTVIQMNNKIKFISLALILVLSVACNKSKTEIVGTYTDVMNDNYVVQIEKSKDGFLVKFPDGEKRTANFVSECNDEKLSVYYKLANYNSVEDCKSYEKGYEQAGGGTLIIGKGGEWVNILTESDVERWAKDPRFKSTETTSRVMYKRKHVMYRNAFGEWSIWRKYDKKWEN